MGAPTTLKIDVVPHIFDCQPKRTSFHTAKPSKAVEKLNRCRDVKEILQDYENQENIANNSQRTLPLTSCLSKAKTTSKEQHRNFVNNDSIQNQCNSGNEQCSVNTNSKTQDVLLPNLDQENEAAYQCENLLLPVSSISNANFLGRSNLVFQSKSVSKNCSPNNVNNNCSQENNLKRKADQVLSFGETVPKKCFSNKGIMAGPNFNQENILKRKSDGILSFGEPVSKKHFRSKGIMARPKMVDVMCQVRPLMTDRGCSPIDIPFKENSDTSSKSDSNNSSKKTSSYATTSSLTGASSNSDFQCTLEEISQEHEEKDLEMKRLSLRVTNYHISRDPKFYIGVPPQLSLPLLHQGSIQLYNFCCLPCVQDKFLL